MNEVPAPEPARILANERVQRGAQKDLHSYSNYVVMYFVSPLNNLLTLSACTQM